MTKFLKIISIPIALGTFGVLLWLENRRPLRDSVESKPIRNARNLAVAGIAAARSAIGRTAARRAAHENCRAEKSRTAENRSPAEISGNVFGGFLLDYTLYLWHVLTHKLPFLWRFHLVHHVDLDMDASTALRFHFGELTISAL